MQGLQALCLDMGYWEIGTGDCILEVGNWELETGVIQALPCVRGVVRCLLASVASGRFGGRAAVELFLMNDDNDEV